MKLRTATDNDVLQLRRFISDSARRLSAGYYSTEQLTACIDDVSGVDTQPIVDRSYQWSKPTRMGSKVTRGYERVINRLMHDVEWV